jgi:hypothetical protein
MQPSSCQSTCTIQTIFESAKAFDASYEDSAIRRCVKDPRTQTPFTRDQLVPNIDLRQAIENDYPIIHAMRRLRDHITKLQDRIKKTEDKKPDAKSGKSAANLLSSSLSGGSEGQPAAPVSASEGAPAGAGALLRASWQEAMFCKLT